MIAYQNDPEVKRLLLDEVRWHREQDKLVAGCYYDPERRVGCGVGCLTRDETGGHAYLAGLTEVPEQLIYLLEAVFEGLPKGVREAWPERFWSAIAPGADLSRIWPQFAAALMRDLLALDEVKADEKLLAAVEQVRACYEAPVIDLAAMERARHGMWLAGPAVISACSVAATAETAARAERAVWAEKAKWAVNKAQSFLPWEAYWKAQANRLVRLLKAAPQAKED